MDEIDMRMFALKVGASVTYGVGSVVFNQGDPGSCMYIVQSGVIEMVLGDKVIEVCGPNEAIGFMSMIDDAPRSSTARVKEACELSLIDQRKFRFMVDEVPNFALYVMGAMARRIRGMSQAMSGSGRASEERVAHRPLVPFAAGRAAHAHGLLADAQQRADLALDPAVDFAPGRGADENEMFHGGFRRRFSCAASGSVDSGFGRDFWLR
jgi:CRP/FNR family transcriptional regulator, cyclic AMP receptor protein